MALQRQHPPVRLLPNGKLVDYIDGTFRNNTDEEYVRQTIEKRLVNEYKYPKDRIQVEYMVKLGASKKRADLVIFPKDLPVELTHKQQIANTFENNHKFWIQKTEYRQGN